MRVYTYKKGGHMNIHGFDVPVWLGLLLLAGTVAGAVATIAKLFTQGKAWFVAYLDKRANRTRDRLTIYQTSAGRLREDGCRRFSTSQVAGLYLENIPGKQVRVMLGKMLPRSGQVGGCIPIPAYMESAFEEFARKAINPLFAAGNTANVRGECDEDERQSTPFCITGIPLETGDDAMSAAEFHIHLGRDTERVKGKDGRSDAEVFAKHPLEKWLLFNSATRTWVPYNSAHPHAKRLQMRIAMAQAELNEGLRPENAQRIIFHAHNF